MNELRGGGMQIAVERVDSEGGLARALREFGPDVVLSEHSLTQFDFRTALRIVHALRPRTPLLVVSGPLRTEDTGSCVRAGAETFISKTNLGRLTPAISAALLARSPLEKLTSRQIEVMRLVADGHRTKDIADRLRLSVKTVESHRQQVMKRLGLRNMAGLVRYTVRVGLALVPPENSIAEMLRSGRQSGFRRQQQTRTNQ